MRTIIGLGHGEMLERAMLRAGPSTPARPPDHGAVLRCQPGSQPASRCSAPAHGLAAVGHNHRHILHDNKQRLRSTPGQGMVMAPAAPDAERNARACQFHARLRPCLADVRNVVENRIGTDYSFCSLHSTDTELMESLVSDEVIHQLCSRKGNPEKAVGTVSWVPPVKDL